MSVNDFDFIKEKFDADGVVAPDAINENEILSRLENKPRLKLYQKKSFKAFVSAAACFALAVGVFAYALEHQMLRIEKDNPITAVSSVKSFNSYDEIQRKIDKLNLYQFYLYANQKKATSDDIDIMVESLDEGLGGGDDSVTSSAFAQTYTQVDGVDEANIIKTDGKYIYYLSTNNEILIYEGESLISKISTYSLDNWNENDDYDLAGSNVQWLSEFYVKDDKLIINGWTDYYDDEKYVNVSNVFIYDISDITAPRLIDDFSQSGIYSTSRMIDNQLYVISTQWLNQRKLYDDCVFTTEGNKKTVMPASSIYYGDTISYDNFIVVSSIDIDSCERTSQPKAFFGCGEEIYCNKNNLYIPIMSVSNSKNETEIVKGELKDGAIEFTAKATVSGYINNQFSMDEKDGCFRIATSDDNGNNLYILDENLNEVGKVKGFAENETIRAVKYIGDMAYVITYEYIDPLFIIDLSDPKSPVIKGSVEITGFSSQLVPVDDNTLLGIGYDDEWGIKLALFDISNPSSPAVLDSAVIEHASSNAQNSHKSIVINKEKGYFAIDYYEYLNIYGYDGYDEYDDRSGGLVFSVLNGKINIDKKYVIKTENYSYANALTYIGDTIYILDEEGEIYSFDY